MTKARTLADFIGSDSDVKFDTDTLYIDSSANRVGFGTTSPGRIAELYGTSNPALRLNNGTDVADIGLATAAGALLTGSTSGALVLARGGANAINLGTNGQNRVTVDSSGLVGIGTSSPSAPLQVTQTPSDTVGNVGISLKDTGGAHEFGLRLDSTSKDLKLDRYYAGSWSNQMTFDRSSGNISVAGDIIITSNGTNGSACLQIDNSNTGSSTFTKVIEAYQAGITVGDRSQIMLGKDGSTYDTASLSYYYAGNASSSNRFEIGFWGADSILNVVANKTVGIGTSAPDNLQYGSDKPKLHVKGDGTSGYTLAARFENGDDAGNDRGSAVLINMSNDRGLLIEGGRGTGDQGVGMVSVLNSGAARIELIRLTQAAGSQTVGYVQTPKNPAFRARATTTHALGANWQTVQYGSLLEERGGSNYNTTTYAYTAPVDGYYQFNAQWNATNNADVDGTLALCINGSTTNLAGSSSMANTDAGSGSFDGHVVSGTCHLSAGDYVIVKRYSTVSNTTRGSYPYGGYFSGFLIG